MFFFAKGGGMIQTYRQTDTRFDTLCLKTFGRLVDRCSRVFLRHYWLKKRKYLRNSHSLLRRDKVVHGSAEMRVGATADQ